MAERERLGKVAVHTMDFSPTGYLNVTPGGFKLGGNPVFGGASFDRAPKIAVVPLAGATIHGGVQAWQNPEPTDILIKRVMVDVTTVAAQAATLSVGTTATSATTASANLLDTLNVRAATGVFDNVTDGGVLGKSRQRLAPGKWISFSEQSGNVTGMVGNAYIEYNNV